MNTQAASLKPGAARSAELISADTRRPDIDGLRGIAVLAVLGFQALAVFRTLRIGD
jgi:peptidoglycan/LPS O-acetylase OafA/YrhL